MSFVKDQMILRGNVQYRVDRKLNDTEVRLENAITGEYSVHKIFNLLKEYEEGSLLPRAKLAHKLAGGKDKSQSQSNMDRLSEPARIETRRRIDYINQLNSLGSFAKSRTELRQDIKDISLLRREERPPHPTTVYRWHRRFLSAQRNVKSLFCQFDKQGGSGQSRFDSEVEAVIFEKIELVFLSKHRCSAEEVYDAVFLAIQQLNTTRIESEWLATPSLRTIQRRLKELCSFELAVARYGKKEAERRFATSLGARATRHILELVEIDHSPVDILVVNEDRIYIGRPTITVVLDRFSRCVLGYHLSLAGHGVPAVFAALSHALLPKTYLKDAYKDLHLEWNCYGWFTTALMDNGSEFHAESVGDALTNIQIIAEFAKSRTPNDKPHVERFLKSFNYGFIHKLPGTTLAKVGERIGFKSEDEACITLEELDRLIHVWVCSKYHLRPHSGLYGRCPIDVWKESAQSFPPQLKLNREDLEIEFSNITRSSIQHYGIDLNNSVYVSTRLLNMRGMLPSGVKVDVKWPSTNVGHIFVWDPQEEEYFKVPNKDDQFDGLTLEQASLARKMKSSGDPNYQLTRSSAGVLVDEHVANAQKDKKLKVRRAGARAANKTSKDSRESKAKSKVGKTEEQRARTAATAPDAMEFQVEVELPEEV